MPRRKRAASPFELFDDDLDDDSQSSRNGNPPIQRNAANARERARMRVLSSAFGRLKTKLPNIPPDTKLSKLDTLRLATMYIKNLRAMAEGNATTSMNANSMGTMQFPEHGSIFGLTNNTQNLSWPFGLHNIQNTTIRQQSMHQCPLMDWSPATATERSKSAGVDSYTTQNPMQTATSSPSSNWYTSAHNNANTIPTSSSSSTSAHSYHGSNFNICHSNANQIPQHHQQHSQQNSQNFSMSSIHNHHHLHQHQHPQHNMSPIR